MLIDLLYILLNLDWTLGVAKWLVRAGEVLHSSYFNYFIAHHSLTARRIPPIYRITPFPNISSTGSCVKFVCSDGVTHSGSRQG